LVKKLDLKISARIFINKSFQSAMRLAHQT
jgi:hypothetical protein